MTAQQALSIWFREEAARLDPPPTLLADVLDIPRPTRRRFGRLMPANALLFALLVVLLVVALALGVALGAPYWLPKLPAEVPLSPTPTAESTPTPSPVSTPVPSLVPSPQPTSPSASASPLGLAFQISRIAFMAGTSDVYVAGPDGADQTAQTSAARTGYTYGFASPFLVGWGPLETAWYGDKLLVIGSNGDVTKSRLELLDVATGEDTVLVPDQPGPHWAAVGSANGSRFVMATESKLIIVSRDGAAIGTYTPPTGYDRWAITDISALSMSADGTVVIATACTDICQRSSDPGKMSYFEIDLSRPKAGSRLLPEAVQRAWGAVISPDGSRIAYEIPTAPQTHQIWVVSRDGSGETQLDAPVNAYLASWSPNGDRIAYSVQEASDQFGTTPIDGSASTTMTEPGYLMDTLTWSGDGSSLVAVWRGDGGRFRYTAYGADRSTATLLQDAQLDRLTYDVFPRLSSEPTP